MTILGALAILGGIVLYLLIGAFIAYHVEVWTMKADLGSAISFILVWPIVLPVFGIVILATTATEKADKKIKKYIEEQLRKDKP